MIALLHSRLYFDYEEQVLIVVTYIKYTYIAAQIHCFVCRVVHLHLLPVYYVQVLYRHLV